MPSGHSEGRSVGRRRAAVAYALSPLVAALFPIYRKPLSERFIFAARSGRNRCVLRPVPADLRCADFPLRAQRAKRGSLEQRFLPFSRCACRSWCDYAPSALSFCSKSSGVALFGTRTGATAGAARPGTGEYALRARERSEGGLPLCLGKAPGATTGAVWGRAKTTVSGCPETGCKGLLKASGGPRKAARERRRERRGRAFGTIPRRFVPTGSGRAVSVSDGSVRDGFSEPSWTREGPRGSDDGSGARGARTGPRRRLVGPRRLSRGTVWRMPSGASDRARTAVVRLCRDVSTDCVA